MYQKYQQKISKILNADNIDDKTKFLLLAALQTKMKSIGSERN